MIKIKRIYDPLDPADGYRVLVDRLWPRGLRKNAAFIDEWLKAVTPSTELRQWLHADGERRPIFVVRYRLELSQPEQADHLSRLRLIAAQQTLTLLTAASDDRREHVTVLAEILAEI